MAKKKLLEDIKLRPARFYRMPGDVVRDRRFDDSERLEILKAWKSGADDALPDAVNEQIDQAIAELDSRGLVSGLAAKNHAAE